MDTKSDGYMEVKIFVRFVKAIKIENEMKMIFIIEEIDSSKNITLSRNTFIYTDRKAVSIMKTLLVGDKLHWNDTHRFVYTAFLWSKQPNYSLWIFVFFSVLVFILYPLVAAILYLVNNGNSLKKMTKVKETLRLKYVKRNGLEKVKLYGWGDIIITLFYVCIFQHFHWNSHHYVSLSVQC